MLQLPNGCSCSNPSVFPSNWNKTGASIKLDWYIQYYFHDPNFKDKFTKGSLRIVKAGLNRFKTLSERREAVPIIMNELLFVLQEGYNPITGHTVAPVNIEYEIAPSTPIYEAFDKVKEKLKLAKSTAADLKCMLGFLKTAIFQLSMSRLPISEVKRKHIKAILEQVGRNRELTAHRFNKYRSYLMMLFNELIEMEATEMDPVTKIKKQKTIQQIRVTLSAEERKLVDGHLKSKCYSFWRFMHIFFHSGTREIELINLKAKDVDLTNQRFKVLVNKGKSSRWVQHTIKDISLPLWKELMAKCTNDEQFIFSKGLVPGTTAIRSDQITKRWYRHVKASKEKGGLGIKADFYSLKHLNTTQMLDVLADADVAKMNEHTSTAMVVNIYDVDRRERQHNRLKKVANTFI